LHRGSLPISKIVQEKFYEHQLEQIAEKNTKKKSQKFDNGLPLV